MLSTSLFVFLVIFCSIQLYFAAKDKLTPIETSLYAALRTITNFGGFVLIVGLFAYILKLKQHQIILFALLCAHVVTFIKLWSCNIQKKQLKFQEIMFNILTIVISIVFIANNMDSFYKSLNKIKPKINFDMNWPNLSPNNNKPNILQGQYGWASGQRPKELAPLAPPRKPSEIPQAQVPAPAPEPAPQMMKTKQYAKSAPKLVPKPKSLKKAIRFQPQAADPSLNPDGDYGFNMKKAWEAQPNIGLFKGLYNLRNKAVDGIYNYASR